MNWGLTMLYQIKTIDKWLEEAQKRRHEEWLQQFDQRCEMLKQQVIHEIRLKFHEAFPNRWYFFLVQRPRDVDGGIPPWGLALKDRDRAEAYEDRVTPVKEIQF